jgi:hypothetical protein
MRSLQRPKHEGMYIAIVTGQNKRHCYELRVPRFKKLATRNP